MKFCNYSIQAFLPHRTNICRRDFSVMHHKSIFGNMYTFEPPGGTKYGGRYTVTLLPGDGIGRELVSSVKSVFRAMRVPIDFEEIQVSGYINNNSPQLQHAIESLKRTKIGLKGAGFLFYV